ncbi:MAG: glycosyltransferase [Cyclobacteriaceae bacterium]
MSLKKNSIKTVSIIICTYKRPNHLRQVIRTVKELIIPEGLLAELLIIDNCPMEEVQRVIAEETVGTKIPFKYVEEARRGIVFARNRALLEAKEQGSDYIAFIDDDDHPDEQWIVQLWACMGKYSATVVSGKMVFNWPESCTLDEEIRRVYDGARGNHATGELLARCGTGNTLIDFEFIRTHNLSFKPLFNLTGGEDSHFFEAMTVLGGKIVWCNEAIVYSDIIEERANEEYVWRRRYNIGYTDHLRYRLLYGRSKAFRKSLRLIFRNGTTVLSSYFSTSNNIKVKGKKRMAELRGIFDAMMGVKYENYADTDGN